MTRLSFEFDSADEAKACFVGLGLIRTVEKTVEVAPRGVFTDAQVRELCKLLAAKSKINAIKLVREVTGLQLKEAKDFVEGVG